MKFLHAADWQIGMKALHVGPVGQRVHDERLAAARHVVQAAKNAHAEFMLVARDAFKEGPCCSLGSFPQTFLTGAIDTISSSPFHMFFTGGIYVVLTLYAMSGQYGAILCSPEKCPAA